MLIHNISSYRIIYFLSMLPHPVSLNPKLKLNKLQRIKSRYKTDLTSQPSRQQNFTFDVSKSAEFTKLYTRLSNHFDLGLLPPKLYTQKEKERKLERASPAKSQQRSHKEYIEKAHTKSLIKNAVLSESYYNPSKCARRASSHSKIMLPEVNGSWEHPKRNAIRSMKKSKSRPHDSELLNPLVDKNFSGVQGLVLHVESLARVYGHLRRNSRMDVVMAEIEEYVLESNEADISSLDEIFIIEETGLSCKIFVFLERILIVLIVEALSRKTKTDKSSLRILLRMVCDQYLSFLNFLHHKGFTVQLNEIKKILELIGSGQEVIKVRKLFHDNKEIMQKISSYLLCNPALREYFHEELGRVARQSINETFFNILQHYSFVLSQSYTTCPPSLRFLSTCPSPYLHAPPSRQYTLALDLDETLIHYKEDSTTLLIRPHCKKFLTELYVHFQVGIFTCAMPDYADWALNQLQVPIAFRLYRHHTVQAGDSFFKDLNRLGRDISKTIIIDNLPQNFILTPQNGIQIRSWTGEKHDVQLLVVMEKLLRMVKMNPGDVRECLPGLFAEEENDQEDHDQVEEK